MLYEVITYPDYKLMLQAHMDELGLIVRNITEEGFLQFERVGGVPEKSLLGQRLDVQTDDGDLIPGYVGTKSHHITRPDEKYVVPHVHQMYIDFVITSYSIHYTKLYECAFDRYWWDCAPAGTLDGWCYPGAGLQRPACG